MALTRVQANMDGAGSRYSVGSFASLTAAVAALGATECTVVIDQSTSITGTTTIPTTMTLEKTRAGVITGAYSLVINGGMTGDLMSAWFGSVATGSYVGPTVTFGSRVPFVTFEMWGADGAGGTGAAAANAAAMQAALNSGWPININQGSYYFDTTLTVNYSTVMVGVSQQYSFLIYTGTGNAIASYVGGRSFRQVLKKFWLKTNNAANNGWGIYFDQLQTYGRIEEVDVRDFGIGGINQQQGWGNVIRKCFVGDIGITSGAAVYGIWVGPTAGQTTSTLLDQNYVSAVAGVGGGVGTGIRWDNAYKCYDTYNITESCDVGRAVNTTVAGAAARTNLTLISPYYEANSTDITWHDSWGYVVADVNPNTTATWEAGTGTGLRFIGYQPITSRQSVNTGFAEQGTTKFNGPVWSKRGEVYGYAASADDNMVFDDDNQRLQMVAPLTGRTYTLPTAVGRGGYSVRLVKTNDVNTQTITPNGAETISGKATYVLNKLGEHVTLISDNTNWQIIEAGGIKQAANADTSGAPLATLETEVNELKAALRSFGIIAP
jgi:hypothetical protein